MAEVDGLGVWMLLLLLLLLSWDIEESKEEYSREGDAIFSFFSSFVNVSEGVGGAGMEEEEVISEEEKEGEGSVVFKEDKISICSKESCLEVNWVVSISFFFLLL